jgi:hypothetical protein
LVKKGRGGRGKGGRKRKRKEEGKKLMSKRIGCDTVHFNGFPDPSRGSRREKISDLCLCHQIRRARKRINS